MLHCEYQLHVGHLDQSRRQSLEEVLSKLTTFKYVGGLSNVASPQEKLKQLAISLPAYDVLSLPMQLAFKVKGSLRQADQLSRTAKTFASSFSISAFRLCTVELDLIAMV